jgi:hypothetical protein
MKKRLMSMAVCVMLLAVSVPYIVAADYKESTNLATGFPQEITIRRPDEGNLYVMGAQIINLPWDLIIIVGPITIEAEVTGGNGFQVEFYIDNELKTTDSSSPFEYPWWELSFGTHTIEVKLVGYAVSDSVQVIKII